MNEELDPALVIERLATENANLRAELRCAASAAEASTRHSAGFGCLASESNGTVPPCTPYEAALRCSEAYICG